MSHVEKNVLFCCHSFRSGLLHLTLDPAWPRQTDQEKICSLTYNVTNFKTLTVVP